MNRRSLSLVVAIVVVLCALLIICPRSGSAQKNGSVGPSRESEVSPKSDLLLEFHDDFAPSQDHLHEVWLVDRASQQRRLLYSYVRWVKIIFSPDEAKIVINDKFASNESKIVLLERVSGPEYKQSQSDPNKVLWDCVLGKYGIPHRSGSPAGALDHAYVDAELWSRDGDAILVSLSGHSGGQRVLEKWYCVYDLKSGMADTDLGSFNRSAMEEKDEASGLMHSVQPCEPTTASAKSVSKGQGQT